MSAPCQFCVCQDFWYTPPNAQAAYRDPPAAAICEIGDCAHSFQEHGVLPGASKCGSCPCPLFQLARKGDRLFSSVCSCTHPFSSHSRVPPPQAAQHIPVQPAAPPPAPAPVQPPPAPVPLPSTSTRFMPFASTFPANQTDQTVNDRRMGSAARRRGVVPPGSMGLRVAPPPAVHLAQPPAPAAPAAGPASSAPSAAPKPRGPGRPPKPSKVDTILLLFPCTVSARFSPDSPFPSLADLDLPADFNLYEFDPLRYSLLVSRMTVLGLAIHLELTGSEAEPPRLWYAVQDRIVEHMALNTLALYPPQRDSAAETANATEDDPEVQQVALFRLLKSKKHGDNVRFILNNVDPDTFSIADIKRAAASVNKSGHLYACPRENSWYICGPVHLRALNNAAAAAIALSSPFHHCFVIRVVESVSPSNLQRVVVAGRCGAICGAFGADSDAVQPEPAPSATASRRARSNSPMRVDDHSSSHPIASASQSRPASSVSAQGPLPGPPVHSIASEFFDFESLPPSPPPVPSPSTLPLVTPQVIPFSAGSALVPPPLSPGQLPVDAARFLDQLSAFSQTPLTSFHLPSSPSPPRQTVRSPPALPQDAQHPIVVSSDDEDDADPGADGTLSDISMSSEIQIVPPPPEDYSSWQPAYRRFKAYLASCHPDVPTAIATRAEFVYAVPPETGHPSLGFSMSQLLRLLHNRPPDRKLDAADATARLRRRLNTDAVSCRNISLKQLFCCSKNHFRIGPAFGPGTERTLLAATISSLASEADYPGLWCDSGQYKIPFKRVSANPSSEERRSYEAAGTASGLSLVRLGYIPIVHPAFLLLLLASKFLDVPLCDPTVLELLLDAEWLAVVDPRTHNILRLWPRHHKAVIPARASSPEAGLLHAHFDDLGFSPTSPRTRREHYEFGLGLFCKVLVGINLLRHVPPPEWTAFMKGFDVELSFRAAVSPDHRTTLSTALLHNHASHAIPVKSYISNLRRILIGVCCPPPSRADLTPRLTVDPTALVVDEPLAGKLETLVRHYLSGDGHPPSLVDALGLDHTLKLSSDVRASLFVRAINGTHFLPPYDPADLDSRFYISLSLTPNGFRAVSADSAVPIGCGDVLAFKFSTCDRSMSAYPSASLRALVDRSLDELRAVRPDKPPETPPAHIDTQFCLFLHGQLLSDAMYYNDS
ncbi:hypothetical protein AURDEDRAFT_159233 [Auricularia subglabra TFB-10046 SS5]|nr:hypothetical protein AURDEDRAFT_159233 [Auricularia subglabra TFB-10046 SS5]